MKTQVWPLPESEPTETMCVQLRIPDNPEYVWLLVDALSQLGYWFNYDRDPNKRAKDIAELWKQSLDTLTFACPPSMIELPEGVTIKDGSLVICTEEMMGHIYIYNGCGCGCGESSGGGGGTGDGGGQDSTTPTPAITSVTTKCEVVSDVIPYFIDQAREWLEGIDTFIDNGGSIADALLVSGSDIIDPTDFTPNAIESIIEAVESLLDPLINTLKDTDFVLTVQRNWWGRVGNNTYTNFTRADAIEMGSSFPVYWGNVLNGTQTFPRALGEVLGRIVDLQRLSQRAFIARGNANETLCEYIASTYGEEYTPPIAPIEQPPTQTKITYESESYTLYQILSSTLRTEYGDGLTPVGVTTYANVVGFGGRLGDADLQAGCGAGSYPIGLMDGGGTPTAWAGNMNNWPDNSTRWAGRTGLRSSVEAALGITFDQDIDLGLEYTAQGAPFLGTTCDQGGYTEWEKFWVLVKDN